MAFVLPDVFAVGFDEVAAIVGRSPAATRQLASRARRRVQGAGGAQTARGAVVNGLAGLVWAPRGDVRGVIQFTVVDGRITAIDVTADVERIDSYDIAVLDT